jgi:hypothetical protein
VLPIPVLSERLFADAYLAGPAPFLGAVVGIPEPLARNRLHGGNTWTPSTAAATRDREALRRRGERYEFEFQVLLDTLQRLGVGAHLSPRDNPILQRIRWAAGEGVSLPQALLAALRCPTLPWPMKWRDLARLALGQV